MMARAGQRGGDREAIPEIYERLGQLDKALGQLATGQDHLARTVGELAEVVSAQRNELASSKQTDWKTLGTWAGVVITLMSICGGLTIAPLYRVAEMGYSEMSSQSREVGDLRERLAVLEERTKEGGR